MTINIGEFNRSGLVQVVDSHWDFNGSKRVTVREMIGGRDSWVGGKSRMIRVMRDTARQAIAMPSETQWTRLDRLFYSEGSWHATFTVSRLDRMYK